MLKVQGVEIEGNVELLVVDGSLVVRKIDEGKSVGEADEIANIENPTFEEPEITFENDKVEDEDEVETDEDSCDTEESSLNSNNLTQNDDKVTRAYWLDKEVACSLKTYAKSRGQLQSNVVNEILLGYLKYRECI